MKIIKKPVEFCVFIQDPNNISRPLAWHLNVVQYLDREDGTSPLQVVGTEMMTSEQAISEGLDVPAIVTSFDTDLRKANDDANEKIEELSGEIHKLEEQVHLLNVALAGANQTISLAAIKINERDQSISDLNQELVTAKKELVEVSKRVPVKEES